MCNTGFANGTKQAKTDIRVKPTNQKNFTPGVSYINIYIYICIYV